MTLDHAPLPLGYQSIRPQFFFNGHRRDSNPHRPGANRWSCRWTTGPVRSALREGFEPSACGFGNRHSFRFELPQRSLQWSTQDSNLQQRDSESGASAKLGYWTVCSADADPSSHIAMHRAGVEPATLRLKIGGSAGLSYRCAYAPGGIRTPNQLLRRELLLSVELPARLHTSAAVSSSRSQTTLLLPSTDAPGRTRTCSLPGVGRRLWPVELRVRALLPLYALATMHPAGVEPATLRLRGGSSTG